MCGEPHIVAGAASLLEKIVEHNSIVLPRLYITGIIMVTYLNNYVVSSKVKMFRCIFFLFGILWCKSIRNRKIIQSNASSSEF